MIRYDLNDGLFDRETSSLVREEEHSYITRHTRLKVCQRAYTAAMAIFELSKLFPQEEKYSLTDQMRRSSRSVAANLAEAWRQRRYPAAFVGKLSDCEAEAAETQLWLQFAVDCAYLDKDSARPLYQEYEEIIAMIVAMIHTPEKRTLT